MQLISLFVYIPYDNVTFDQESYDEFAINALMHAEPLKDEGSSPEGFNASYIGH